MNNIKSFNFEELEVRTLVIENEPYFIGRDVAIVLGYKDPNDALKRHVEADDKLIRGITDSAQKRYMTVINESGLYSLILSSKLAKAKKFKRWVTKEVIPTIRKHGMYATESTIERMLQDPEAMIKTLQELQKERTGRLVAEQQVAELQPKADYYDQILRSNKLIAISAIAKDYGMSAQEMNKLLHDLKVQYKQGNQWLLYQKHARKGYTSSQTHKYVTNDGREDFSLLTKWTQKGRIFLYNLLKENNILPMIELYEAEVKGDELSYARSE